MRCGDCKLLEVDEELFCPVKQDYLGDIECSATKEDFGHYYWEMIKMHAEKEFNVRRMKEQIFGEE